MLFRQSHSSLYLLPDEDADSSNSSEGSDKSETNPDVIGNASCVTKFVKTLLSLVSRLFLNS